MLFEAFDSELKSKYEQSEELRRGGVELMKNRVETIRKPSSIFKKVQI